MGEETSVSIEQIAQAHPKNLKPIPTERAICDQIERLMRVKGRTFEQAAEYLLARTKLYAEHIRSWPLSEFPFIPEAHNWFMQGCYAADEKLWVYHGNNQAAKEPGVFDWRRDMLEHPENYVQGKQNGRD